MIIGRLVESAFKTGCLSVESEGLIRQILRARGYRPADLIALQRLCKAIESGEIEREFSGSLEIWPIDLPARSLPK